ncbi:O-antigen ligase family protein [Streptosporangium carneum]|uniref:O-antigen ligase-related domain-containing protein n=1 Tax=Streptosporangium carneum TaxID=47481 RepID=A0A9W6MH14_9ACTN|nr:O-antigen ligase family protein [Streptosporangium carneum]GLK14364.1 hypothetical protein GCM10017600_77760 [Streptosporangium carneum]
MTYRSSFRRRRKPPPINPAPAPATTLSSVYCFLLLLLPSQYVIGPLGGAGTPAGVFAVVILLAYLLAWLAPRSTAIRQPQPLRIAMVLFGAAVLASYASGMTRQLTVLEINGLDRGLIIAAGWIGSALIICDGVDRMDLLEKLRRRVVAFGTAIAALGVLQFFTALDLAQYIQIPGLSLSVPYSSVHGRDEFNRIAATAAHPIEFGVVLGLLLPLALHGARHAPPELRRRRWAQVMLIAAALPMTISRTAMLGAVLVAVVVVPTWTRKERRRAYVLFGAFGVVMRLAIPGLLGTIFALFENIGNDSSTQFRLHDYSAATDYFSEHPWFGRGFGTFLPNLYRILDNQYLVTLIEMGVIGSISVVVCFGTGWVLARRARRLSDDPELRHLAQCVAASVLVGAVSLATYDSLAFPMCAGLMFVVMGFAGAVYNIANRAVPQETPISTSSEPVLQTS